MSIPFDSEGSTTVTAVPDASGAASVVGAAAGSAGAAAGSAGGAGGAGAGVDPTPAASAILLSK